MKTDSFRPNIRRVSLSKTISAVHLTGDCTTECRGEFAQLRAGAVLEIDGMGFNSQMVRVRVADQFYFVFCRDINLKRDLPSAITSSVPCSERSAGTSVSTAEDKRQAEEASHGVKDVIRVMNKPKSSHSAP